MLKDVLNRHQRTLLELVRGSVIRRFVGLDDVPWELVVHSLEHEAFSLVVVVTPS